MESLRERKKAATRGRISDVATAMMVERGFDDVTIAEIAEAAEVSKVTVFNYFPRKEDIFLDRGPEAIAVVTEAVRNRGKNESPLRALRRLLLGLAEERHPLAGFRDSFPAFWRTVLRSAPLRARAREAAEELEGALARELAEAGDPQPRLSAALAVAAFRTVYLEGIGRMLDGDPAEDVTRDHIAAVGRAFDTLERGLG